ncbi:Uncharacterised protein [Legionella busanensis]|uniref:Uncharacterized protein n=1 Tax=Legionella busanensis TaxID=190655 RepID=A0A378KHK7_9GAMM|nr:hypothetical protein [Legionella busanensis]STX81274.1 Uncharacterised protein [Legionella busanensis]
MTIFNLPKLLSPIKSFFSRSKKGQVYLSSLERAYMEQAAELMRLKHRLNNA